MGRFENSLLKFNRRDIIMKFLRITGCLMILLCAVDVQSSGGKNQNRKAEMDAWLMKCYESSLAKGDQASREMIDSLGKKASSDAGAYQRSQLLKRKKKKQKKAALAAAKKKTDKNP